MFWASKQEQPLELFLIKITRQVVFWKPYLCLKSHLFENRDYEVAHAKENRITEVTCIDPIMTDEI